MNILIYDPDKGRAHELSDVIGKYLYDTEKHICIKKKAVLKQIEQKPVDIAFIRTEPDHEFCEFIMKIRERSPMTNIIITAHNKENSYDEMNMRVSAYIFHPYYWPEIFEEMRNIESSLIQDEKKLYIQALGVFEVFYDHVPVNLKYTKSRELLAYLFFRKGRLCSHEEIVNILFGEEGHDSYIRQLKKDIADMAEKIGLPGLLIKKRGFIGLNMNYVSSDYDDWMNSRNGYQETFQGGFLKQYAWAQGK